MTHISRQQLEYNYQWNAIPPDDARVTGRPDTTFLSRHEGYEVLAFSNRTSADHEGALKAERLIHQHLPSTVRSHANVLQWLRDNWAKYP